MVPYSEFNGDVTVVGGDEVFSVEIGYNAVMYGYGIKSNRLVSYAASFGPSTTEDIKQKELTEDIQKGLAQFNAISVRDRNSQNVVRDLSDKKVPLVIDPVLLYGYPEEQQQYIPNEKGYIAVYTYDSRMNDPEEFVTPSQQLRSERVTVINLPLYQVKSDRTIESFSEIDDVVQNEINFDHVNQLLAQKQKDSLKYLTNAIEGKDE